MLWAFLRLGLTSFGGPVAHLGYFREAFVVRRRWLDERHYADLVALCQFLPGPASSQVGFAIGLTRAGIAGGIAAWVGFTLPSALLMVLFAAGAERLDRTTGAGPLPGLFPGILHGLKLVAVAIVAQAVWGMARTLTPDRARAAIAVLAAILVLSRAGLSPRSRPSCWAGSAAGGSAPGGPPPAEHLEMPVTRGWGIAALIGFVVLLAVPPIPRGPASWPALALFQAFYRSGALVFGGGHVVLPLLRDAVVAPGWVNDSAFLAGYGAAQAIPGPLFTFAAYLGFVATPVPHRLAGAMIGLAGIFLPGILILIGVIPFWENLRRRHGVQAVMRGINAAVVGILAAALYDPVWTGAVGTIGDALAALAGFALLTRWRLPPLVVVALGCAAGVLLARF